MSAKKYMTDKNNIVNHTINLCISLIVVVAAFGLSSSDTTAREINRKIESKADKIYVDKEINQAITEHEKVDAARYNGITEMFNVIREEQAEMRQDIKEILRNSK